MCAKRKNLGKAFEDKVREDIERAGIYVLRLYDPPQGIKGIGNPCDFIVHRKGVTYMLECKSVHGNRIPIYSTDEDSPYGNVSKGQWEGMLHAQQHGIVAGLMVWWIDKDVTKFIPIRTANKLREEGNKSIKYDVKGGGIVEVHGVKKRVYFDYDFDSFFVDLMGA